MLSALPTAHAVDCRMTFAHPRLFVFSSSGVDANPLPDDPTHLKGTIMGPKDTPFEGGTFIVDIVLPSSYPFEPPKCKFDTKIWHPNVSSQTGAICLDILKDQWSPALNVKTVLLSISALLTAAEPSDPQDAEVAKQYMESRELYNNTGTEMCFLKLEPLLLLCLH